MMVNLKMERNMDKEGWKANLGYLMVNGQKEISFKGMQRIRIRDGIMKENGGMENQMEEGKGYIIGPLKINMKVNLQMVSFMDMENQSNVGIHMKVILKKEK